MEAYSFNLFTCYYFKMKEGFCFIEETHRNGNGNPGRIHLIVCVCVCVFYSRS